MSAPLYNIRPGGFEDEDSDDDGFFLGSIDEDKKFTTNTSNVGYTPPPSTTSVPGGRGGFGMPKPKPADKRNKFKRSNVNKTVGSPAKSLSLGDLQNAVVRGNVEAVKKYLNDGYEVDTVLPSGWTPLMYATSGANVKLTQELLDRGANPNFQKDMYYVLMAACGSTGYMEADVLTCVNLLLDRGADVNVYDRYHMSPLMCAARGGNTTVIERLVQAGANLDKQDSRGYTSLSWAVSKGNLSAVRALLKAGADPKKKHCDGQTAIDIAMSDEMIEVLGGQLAQTQMEPSVAMTTMSPRGDAAVIPKSTATSGSNNNNTSNSSHQYGTTYGELELFLCGLDLSHMVPLFQSQHVEFNTFLRLTEEDLIKMGISQIGVRKKILDGIMTVHKKEWEKSSLPSIQYNKTISCPESIAMVANVSKHTKYITTTLGYIHDQINKHPAIVQDLQDGTGPKQLHQHIMDTQRNVTVLQTQLEEMRKLLDQTLSKGNFEPPDILNNTKLHQKSSKLYYIGLTVVGGVILSVIWNRQALMEKAWTLWPK